MTKQFFWVAPPTYSSTVYELSNKGESLAGAELCTLDLKVATSWKENSLCSFSNDMVMNKTFHIYHNNNQIVL